jgi:excisionase family DNA binding protein
MPPEKLWTVADVADYLGVTARTVRNWQQCNRLPYLKIGGTVRFRHSDVIAWVDGFEEGPGEAGENSLTA